MIRTPDQRVRVFVSSTLQELASERAAARQAIATLRHIPVMFELGARPHHPRNLYRAYLEQSDIFVGIYWQSYGWTAPDMDVSGLEDEYILSEGKPKLIYIKTPAPNRDPGLQRMISRLKSEDTTSYKQFSTPEELRGLIENDLALLLTESFTSAQSSQAPSPRFPIPGPQPPTSNLPAQFTSFIGREKEVEYVYEMIRRPEVRLVTFTGPGGTGKTRLALQVGQKMVADFPDGVHFVNLAPLSDAGLVLSTIGQTLGVQERGGQPFMDTLQAHLKDKRMLLVLDNFEHVTQATGQVSQLLTGCTHLKALVTSRIPLRIRGEKEFLVAPLELPDPKHLPPVEKLGQYESVRLFIERATDIKPDFQVTNENAPAIVEICVRLDGLPLAIELAAARTRLFTPGALLSRLSSRLKMLTGGASSLPARQQTLRNTIEWSYDLLDEGEKQLFCRVAVFQGGRTLEALETVCNYDGRLEMDVLEGVESLVSKSLLQQREGSDGEPRFWMLETIHEYAREKLQESKEAEPLEREYALYFMRLAEEAEPHLAGKEQAEWLDMLEDEYDNIRATLRWSREQVEQGEQRNPEATEALERGLRIAGAMWRFWFVRGYFSEGREQLEKVLPSRRTSGAIKQVGRDIETAQAKVLHGIGALAIAQGDYPTARALSEESLAIRRELGDKLGVANSLNSLGIVTIHLGDYIAARSLYEESLAIRRELGDKAGIANSLNNLGGLAQEQGDYAAARSLYEESLVMMRELEHSRGVALSLDNLGHVTLEQGDYTAARPLLEEGLAIRRELGDKLGMTYSLNGLGNIAKEQGDYVTARSLYEESLAIRRELGEKKGIAASLASLGGLAAGGMGTSAADQPQPERAAKLFGAVDAILEVTGGMLESQDRHPYERNVATVRSALGEEVFERVWAKGRTMSMEEAIEYALEYPMKPDDT